MPALISQSPQLTDDRPSVPRELGRLMLPFATLVLAVVLAVITAAILTTFFIPTIRTIKLIEKLPGPAHWPVIGVSYEIAFVKKYDLVSWLHKKVIDGYERVAAVWLLGVPLVFINSPQDVEVILSSMKHIEKGVEYFSIESWLNEGLLTSKGKKWHMRRKMLTPTFHFKILEDKSLTMYGNAKRFVSKLLEENGRPFDPQDRISRCTLDVICEAAMGIKINSQEDESGSKDYLAAISRVTTAAMYRVLNMYLRRDWLWGLTSVGAENVKDVKFLHDYTEKIITERKANYNPREMKDEEFLNDNSVGMKKRQAFLDKLLELGQSMSDSDIREEVDTFLFEGHDTTAVNIEFALFELGQNPEVQELAYNEQFSIFGEDEREATLGDLQNMNYLDRFIKECLRLYPSVPYISRKIVEDVPLKDSLTIPEGANVVITPYFLHRNPRYFPDPEKFDPDRFLPENCAKRHSFAYIPFSAGPRNCIGQKFAMMELKVILSTLLRFARVEAVSHKSELQLATVVLLRNLGTLKIRVLPRNNKEVY
ncbi:hypothetical protein GE061_011140 [Apolygus lucorum]|uniref:Cytochrome P450 n=1 Tax=Apolygus lucorum TaxID=248454 RepID=A0A6A4K6F2_APOLU|nr:hypothetical protein GE061_011140 [Apolygus lucorum]